MPLFTLIIINDNAEKYCHIFFESLKTQRVTNVEYETIFVDNLSSDGSAAVAERNGAKVIFQDCRTEHLGSLYNAGLRAASGSYIIFMHSDIILPPDFIQHIAEFLETSDCEWLNIPQRYVDDNEYGFEHLGLDEKTGQLYYRSPFSWKESVHAKIEISEGCFIVKQKALEALCFDETYLNSFFYYDLYLKKKWKTDSIRTVFVRNYLLDLTGKAVAAKHDEAIFLAKSMHVFLLEYVIPGISSQRSLLAERQNRIEKLTQLCRLQENSVLLLHSLPSDCSRDVPLLLQWGFDHKAVRAKFRITLSCSFLMRLLVKLRIIKREGE